MPASIDELNSTKVQRKIVELRALGKGWGTISKILEKLYGIEVHRSTLQKKFSENKNLRELIEVKERDIAVRDKEDALAEKIDVMAQLLRVNHMLENYMYELMAADQPALVLKAMQELRKQMEYQSKILGDIKESSTQYNVLNLTQYITEKAQEAEKDGFTPYVPHSQKNRVVTIIPPREDPC